MRIISTQSPRKIWSRGSSRDISKNLVRKEGTGGNLPLRHRLANVRMPRQSPWLTASAGAVRPWIKTTKCNLARLTEM
jgi:hypothetical protein